MILVTNDDGIESEGLKTLARSMETLDTVYIVAPDRERSATGMAVTLQRPLRIKQIASQAYAVDGTPVDCVNLALAAVMPEWPSLIVSGINKGSNLGNDIYYSGTVAAAIRGAFLRIPSIAISLIDSIPPCYYKTAADVAIRVAKMIQSQDNSDDLLLNINVPNLPISQIQGIEITRQDRTAYAPGVEKRINPKGMEYYWTGGTRKKPPNPEGIDLHEVACGKVSITPLQLDLTDYKMREELAKWDW
ncbi:MAG: 5'/3'-nucleotidase SurE [Deltaproteobacteria bacterium]|nr:5'/3'-nucleotidase SurE [Deltaproteobacteria bacterium]